MSFTFHHLDKWVSGNIDLIEENFETNNKCVVFISGASSSGKSYCAEILSSFLKKKNYNPVIISLDAYNVGISHIIPRKVNENYYGGNIKYLSDICSRIHDVIVNEKFEEKFSITVIEKLKPILSSYFSSVKEEENFLSLLVKEWKNLNFDEPSVYDMDEASKDIISLLNGESIKRKSYSKIISEREESNEIISSSHDVIIVEGIYALNDSLLNKFDRNKIITDFIDSNPKTLFLRRILRDKEITSASSAFTISLYFRSIVKSYLDTILPSKRNADIIFYNDLSFAELKNGNLYVTKREMRVNDENLINTLLNESIIKSIQYEKDTYLIVKEEKNKEENILRLRSLSSDLGRSYIPSSLVHKGYPKIRKDNKIIRPINILIKEGEFFTIFKDEDDCLSSFASIGFIVDKVTHKIKWKINYKDHNLTIRKVENKGYYIEFDKPYDEILIKEFYKMKA